MENRIARFAELTPLPHFTKSGLPAEALDMLYARSIWPVIQETETAVATAAPIVGGGGLTLGFATCPPGQGPGLHRHGSTYETFIVLDGKFEYFWGADGEQSAVLEKYDTVSFPPGVYRAFRAVSETDATMLAIITGYDQNDITVAAEIGEQLEAIGTRDQAEALGFKFAEG
jgi:quercetin dioxygenase-like cupin family protein